MRTYLDISRIKTVKQIEETTWEEFADDRFKGWVRYITSYPHEPHHPVTADDLDEICFLSKKASNVRLGWSMGELYFTRSFQLELLNSSGA